MGETPPKLKWLELDREQRRRVSRAVRKGRAVDDPRDAPYAVAFADASLEWLAWNRRFRPVHRLARALFHPGSRVRRRLIFSLGVMLAALVALGVAAATLTARQTHRWARKADRVCAREQARLVALPDGLSPFEEQERANAVERDALV